MERQANGTFWVFKRPFLFEVNAPLEEVIRSLSRLNEGPKHHEMSVMSSGTSYTFRYCFQYAGKGGLYTTASSEGHVWQRNNGIVSVQGTTEIDTSLYRAMGIMGVMFALTLRIPNSLPLFFSIFFVLAAVTFYQYHADRNRMLERLSEAVEQPVYISAANDFQKEKRIPLKPESLNPNSVWNEAISEYDSPIQESQS